MRGVPLAGQQPLRLHRHRRRGLTGRQPQVEGPAQPAPSPPTRQGPGPGGVLKALQMAVWIPGRHPGGAGREQLIPYISYGKLGTTQAR